MSRIFSFIVGIALICGSIHFTRETIDLKRKGIVASGVIVDQHRKTDLRISHQSVDYSVTYSPVVEFSAGGKPIRFSSNLWSSWPKPHIGEKVGVLYDKDHPEDARIDGFLENWFAPIALAVLGICLTLSAFGVFQANNDESSACWEMTSID